MAGPIFSHIWNPYPVFPGRVHSFHGYLYPGLGRPHWGFPHFEYLDPFRMQARHQYFGAQGSNSGPGSLGFSITGPTSYDRYRNTTVVAYINKQGGTHSHTLLWLVVDLFLLLQTQGIPIRARHIPGCLNVKADWLSRPNQPITTEWSLHPEIVNQIFGMWGTPAVDMFVTVHNTHLLQFVSSSGALSIGDRCSVTRLAGEVGVLFSTFPLLSQVIQKLRTIQEGEVILIAPWWPSQPWFSHLLHLCVDHPCFFPYRETNCHNTDMYQGASHTICMQRLSCSTTKQQDFQRRSLDSQQLLKGPLQTECMTTGSLASLTGPQDRELIRLVPQLLKLPLFCITFLILMSCHLRLSRDTGLA